MHGFGRILVEPEDEMGVFGSEWELRVFGLVLAAGALGKWSIDESRYARERQHPADYLSHSYYENWLAGLEKLLVESGLLSEQELRAGRSLKSDGEDSRESVLKPTQVAELLAQGTPVQMESHTTPRFEDGDRVRALNRRPASHTREPRYVRGRTGVIHAYYGAHVFPDRSAEGVREGHHLYSVRFDAFELWGDDADRESAVFVDLWEDYLEPA